MYTKDDIVYAGSPEPLIKIINIQALDDYQLKVQFSTGEIKLFDSSYLFDFPVFIPLKDKAVFAKVYLSHGVPCWLDGTVDIAPETVYEKGVEL
jgi:hypothetical protein